MDADRSLSGVPLLVRIPPRLLRRIRERVEAAGSPYEDVTEFLVTAAENLIALEESGLHVASMDVPLVHDRPQDALEPNDGDLECDLLARPGSSIAMAEASGLAGPLFVMTNRLSPLPTALRILVGMVNRCGGGVGVQAFAAEASQVARRIGFTLLDVDRKNAASGTSRLAVGWPIGDDEAKALDRFRSSFLLERKANRVHGPLLALGLAAVSANKVLPTRLGFELANAPNPVLGECEARLLSDEQRALLRCAVLTNGDEVRELGQIVLGVRQGNGLQSALDAFVTEMHPKWTANQATAHRAAALGRLRDMGVAEVSGRGPETRIQILETSDGFVAEAMTTAEGAATHATVA